MLLKNLFESFNDWSDGRWVHYSDHDMLTVNSKQTHGDPKGIYFFPESFKPWSYWLKKKNCFSVSIKPDAKILDLTTIDEDGIWNLVNNVGAQDIFKGYIEQYPPNSNNKMMKMAWEMMCQKMIGKTGEWNAILRRSWDAIFDDSKVIHSNEAQLLVLNPSIITDIKLISQKPDVYKKMLKIINDFKSIDFGGLQMHVIEPKRKIHYGVSTLIAYIIFSDDEKYEPEIYNSKDRYAKIKIAYEEKEKQISVYLEYSNPRLDYGVGTTYDIYSDTYQNLGNISGLKNIRKNVMKVFEHKKSP